MVTWSSFYSHDFSGDPNTAAGGPNSHVIDDGGWTDVFGNYASVNGGKLVLTPVGGSASYSGNWLLRNVNASDRQKDQAMIVRVAPGDFLTNRLCTMLSMFGGQSGATQDFLNCTLSSSGVSVPQFQIQVICANDSYLGTSASARVFNSPVAGNGTSYYDFVMTKTGTFPFVTTISMYDQTATPPAFNIVTPTTNLGTLVLTATANDPTQTAPITYWENLSGPGVMGFDNGATGITNKVQCISLWKNTDLQPAQPNIISVATGSVHLQAYVFGGGACAYGGTGNYTFYWHRSTSSGFTPSNGTRISGALTDNADYTDTGANSANTSYYYALETNDGVTQLYTYPGYSSSANVAVITPSTTATDLRHLVMGHSYTVSTGASNTSTTIGVGSGFQYVCDYYITNGTFGTTPRNVSISNSGFFGTTMLEWSIGRSMLRPALQLALMQNCNISSIMLSTNDGSGWTVAQATAFWQQTNAFILRSLPVMKYLVMQVAPPTLSSNFTFANSKVYAQAQLVSQNGKTTFISDLDIITRWNDSNINTLTGYRTGTTTFQQANTVANTGANDSTSYPTMAAYRGGPYLYTDSLHPNDWGHQDLGLSLAHAFLTAEQIYTDNASSGGSTAMKLIFNPFTNNLDYVGSPGGSSSISSIPGSLSLASTNIVNLTTFNSPYTVGANDLLINCDTSAGPITINLPNPNTYRILDIKDAKGTFGTNNVTLVSFGGEKIEGLTANLILRANWGCYQFTSNGTDWLKTSTAANKVVMTYTTPGTATLVCPAGVTNMDLEGCGGGGGGAGSGGGGGGSTAAAARGGGGGGPGCSTILRRKNITVVPGTSYTITVGAGGAAGTAGTAAVANAAGATGGNGGNGGAGGDTTFGSLATFKGGNGGTAGTAGGLSTTGQGGAGGTSRENNTNGAGGSSATAGTAGSAGTGGPGSLNANSSGAGGGGTSGASQGAGGGGGGQPGGTSFGAPVSNSTAAGGAGGNAADGSPGTAGATQSSTNYGCGGSGAGAGGGGGIVPTTGSNGGAGAAGSAGIGGYLSVTWLE